MASAHLVKKAYAPETIGSVMSVRIPVCHPDDDLRAILKQIAAHSWDSVRNVYVVEAKKLLGYIDMAQLIQSDHSIKARDLMKNPSDVLHPEEDQEKAVFLAVKDNDVTLPVVDREGRLLGAVTARRIIDIMHVEHLEDSLLASGVRRGTGGIQFTKLITERTGLIVRSRAPWLIVGLAAGLGLGLISSFFEETLQKSIALAYFVPVVAYVADSVGTQSGTISVRALATMKLSYRKYLFKELLTGIALGLLMGVLGTIGAIIIARSVHVGLVVGAALFVASAVAAVLATAVSIFFKVIGKDPALGSGPLATALQDVISVIIYFAFAVALL